MASPLPLCKTAPRQQSVRTPTVEKFDFIVVGAGMAGASVAAELAGTGKVALLEQEKRAGVHATGRSAALHSEIYGNATIRALSRASRDFFLAPRGDAPSFARPRGCLHVASAAQLAKLEAFGSLVDVCDAVSVFSADQTRARVPVLRAEYLAGALYEHNAYDLDVDAIHQFFLRALAGRGGKLFCNQPFSTAERVSDHWRVPLGDDVLQAPVLINAAGAWGDIVARGAKVEPVGLEPRRRTVVLVDPPIGISPNDWPAVIDIDEQFYFKPDAGKILLSPADETPSDPCDAYPEELDIALAVERVQAAADIPVTRIPHSWAGLRTFVPDKRPVVGFDRTAPGFFWLVGQGGYGIQTAPALSRVAAALARHEPLPSDVVDQGFHSDQVDPQRLRRQEIRTSRSA